MKQFLKSLLNHNFLLSEYFVDLMWAKNLVSAEALNSFPASVKGERNPVVIQWHTKVWLHGQGTVCYTTGENLAFPSKNKWNLISKECSPWSQWEEASKKIMF